MTIKLKSSLCLVAALAWGPALYAAEPAPADTITVVEEDATPEDVVSTITLPIEAAAKAVEAAKKGLDTANAAREMGGNSTAAEARARGRELGESAAEEARQSNPAAQVSETASEARSDKAPDRPAPPARP
jgi:hypothetical protein